MALTSIDINRATESVARHLIRLRSKHANSNNPALNAKAIFGESKKVTPQCCLSFVLRFRDRQGERNSAFPKLFGHE